MLSSGALERSLTDLSLRQIASEFGSALLDLTGKVYEVEIVTLERHPDDEADIRLWVRHVEDGEISDAEKR